jgi:hypothetical protein
MVNQSDSIKELAGALAKAQAEITGAHKDSTNPFFKSKYADLESVWGSVREPLAKNGLCVVQTTEPLGESLVLVTTLAHSSGEWIRGYYPLHPIKNDPQGMGSCITYARRYALAAIVGVYQTDDDGEAAMRKPTPSGGSTRGIAPQEPGPEDGIPHDAGYRIPFGKFAKRSLEEVPFDELRGYIDYLEASAAKKGQTITGPVLEFIERASSHIAAFENSPLS